MSGKFLARASALSLAMLLAACGGGDDSTPLVDSQDPENPDQNEDGTNENETDNDGSGATDGEAATILLGVGEGDNFSAEQLFEAQPTITQGEPQRFPLTLLNQGTEGPALNSGLTVTYVSRCIDAGTAEITGNSATSADSGYLEPTYTALPASELEEGQTPCYGEDRIHAFLDDPSEPAASGTVIIKEPQYLDLALTAYDLSTSSPGAANKIKTTESNLPTGGDARLTVGLVNLQDGSLQTGNDWNVSFTSRCTEDLNTSELSSTNVQVTSGIAETIFTAGDCGGTNPQVVEATIEELDLTADVKITVDPAVAFQIDAADPDPMSIAPSDQSSEGRSTSSRVTFTLRDQAGNPLGSEPIKLAIDETNTAEFADGQGNWTDSITLQTGDPNGNSPGQVSALVRATQNSDHTEFRVIATHDGLSSYSKPIVINSTLPFQDNFSLSAENFAPDTWGENGVTSSLTIFAADVFGNRIRENTYVNFETDEGSIDPDCVITDGKCTVTWESLNTSQSHATITASTYGRISETETGTIESDARLVMSTNDNITVTVTRDSDLNEAEGTRYCSTASVSLNELGGYAGTFAPPVGTTITFNINEGELAPGAQDSRTLASSSSLVDASEVEFCTTLLPAVEEFQADANGNTETFERFTIDVSVTAQTPGDEGASDTAIAPIETWNTQN